MNDSGSRIVPCAAGQILSIVALSLISSSFTSAQSVGDCVCMEGYIMDEFCINRGTLFDNPTQSTLIAPGPEVHSLHCLVDIEACINSGYTVLQDDDGDGIYTVGYRFDDYGDALLKNFGIQSGALGACDECDGSSGSVTSGLRATVVGTIESLGVPSDDPVQAAPTLAVTQVFDSSVGCNTDFTCQRPPHQVGDCVVVEGYIMDEFCINRGTLFDDPTQPTLIAPGPEVHSIHCLVDVPACINSGYTVLEDNGDDTFSVAYRLDDVGDALVKELAIQSGAAGACDECDGSEGGTATAGFRATIVGRVTQLGDALSSDAIDQAPTLEVSQVLPSEVSLMGLECTEPEPELGDCICTEGYIMDEFCINRGTLFDNPTQETLVAPGPEVHSLHCLVDVPQCIASGYTVLSDNGDDTFSVGYRLDNAGDAMILEFAIQSGAAFACDECLASNVGDYVNGFRATVVGRVTAVGDSSSSNKLAQAHTLAVAEIVPSIVGCANFDSSSCPALPDNEEEVDVGLVSLVLSEDPMVQFDYQVLSTSSGDVLDVTLTYKDEGWVGLGISPNGNMVGSEAVIAIPPTIPEKYSLSMYDVAGVIRMPDEQQTLMDASVVQENGTTTMKFQRLLREEGELEITVGEQNSFIYAVGNTNELAYHRKRSPFTATVLGGERSARVGDCIVVEGYIMDEFCIKRGTLFDNRNQATLIAPGPEIHSLHCLVDVEACINSGYTVLEEADEEGNFAVAYRFDDIGDGLIYDFAISMGAAGACNECDGSGGGNVTAGFRAKIVGTIAELGDSSAELPLDRAHLLEVVQVVASDTTVVASCPSSAPEVGDCVCTEGFIMDEFCINRGTLFDNPTQETLVAPGPEVHSLHCLVDVEQCIASGYTVLADNGDGTFSVGYRLDNAGDAMMLDFAIQSGAADACNECDVSFGGTVTAGFRATVIGTIVEVGDSLADEPIGKAHTLSVGQILPSGTDCGNFKSVCPAIDGNDDEDEETHAGPVILTVSEDPEVILEYEVLTPENTEGLTAEAIAAGGVLNVTLTYAGEGWVAFGISPDQTMINSETIIARYPTIPEKYRISQYAETGIARRPDDEQTLIDPWVTQENGTTVMSFQKLLREEGEYELVIGDENGFIWAVGNENVLGYHAVRSFFTATLQAGAAVTLGSLEPPNKALWICHGTLAILAWGVLAPLAIGASLSRNVIPVEGMWFQIHLYLNFSCIVLTIIFFVTAIAGTEKAGLEHFSGAHQRVGLSVFAFSLFQVMGGLARPHPPGQARVIKEDPDFDMHEKAVHPSEEAVKSSSRRTFELGHRIFGATLIGLAFFNIDEGLKIYAARYDKGEDYAGHFWIWVVVIIGLITIGALTSKFI